MRIVVFFIVFVCWVSTRLIAQDPYAVHLSKNNGLPSNAIYDLYESRNGFVWIAGDHGLARYDGFEYKLYTSPNQKSKSGTNIKEDIYGRIWYVTFDGFLFYVENDSLKSFPFEENASSYDYALIDKYLFFLKKDQIIKVNIFTLKEENRVSLSKYSKEAMLSGIWQTEDAFYVVDFNASFYKGDLALNLTPVCDSRQIFSRITGISVVSIRDTLYFATYLINEGNQIMRIAPNEQPKRFYHSDIQTHGIRTTKDDVLWMMTTQGVYQLGLNGDLINDKKPFFSNYSISDVLKDRENNYWISTTNEGLFFVPNLNTQTIEAPNFKPNRLAKSNHALLIGTKFDEIFQLSSNKTTLVPLLKNTEKHEVLFLYNDTLGKNIYFASQVYHCADYQGNILHSNIIAIKKAERIDHKYFAIAASGLFGLQKQPLNNEPSEWDSLFQAHFIHSIHENFAANKNLAGFNSEMCRAKSLAFLPQYNTIFYVSNLGLFKAVPKRISEVFYQNKKIYSSYIEAYQNTVYCLSNDNQLFTIDHKGNVSLLLAKNLVMNRIKILSHYLFIWSNKQLYVIDVERKTDYPTQLDVSVSADEINDIIFEGNKLVIATDAGLIFKSWEDAQLLREKALLRINQILINNKYYSDINNIEVDYTENNIEIKYSILAFHPSMDKTLYYRINQGAWQITDPNSRTLVLAALSPNTYQIDFCLGNTKQVPSQSIYFTITPPFWKRPWFIGLILLIIGGMLAVFYVHRTQLLKKQNELLLEKLKLESDLRHSLLSSIKSQMNPHFFFNALNTIQSFIFADDKRSAANYLGKFARLMRMILEMSEKDYVSLNEEIQSLKMYLDLENTRFNQELKYEIVISPEIFVDNVQIPSMIIQPYIENAVKHGLLHKKGMKILVVEISQNADYLRIKIEDNGIGRKRSAELNKIKQKKHSSFATQANLKRIELLNKENPNIGVEYTDKEDENGQAQGTIVLITLPIIKLIVDN